LVEFTGFDERALSGPSKQSSKCGYGKHLSGWAFFARELSEMKLKQIPINLYLFVRAQNLFDGVKVVSHTIVGLVVEKA